LEDPKPNLVAPTYIRMLGMCLVKQYTVLIVHQSSPLSTTDRICIYSTRNSDRPPQEHLPYSVPWSLTTSDPQFSANHYNMDPRMHPGNHYYPTGRTRTAERRAKVPRQLPAVYYRRGICISFHCLCLQREHDHSLHILDPHH
jgi:hypothetical protein